MLTEKRFSVYFYFLAAALMSVVMMRPFPCQATNGYWSHGFGPKSKSMGGACVAMAFGAMCAATNPGSLAVVGNRLELGAAVFSPERGFIADDNAMTPPYASMPPGNVAAIWQCARTCPTPPVIAQIVVQAEYRYLIRELSLLDHIKRAVCPP